MEPNRVWHEPEVVIYGTIITPGKRCSAQAYDLANRRWYQINTSSDAYDEEWMSDIVENHISEYYHTSGSETPFNVINVTNNGSLTFDTQPNEVVVRPVRERLKYQPHGENGIPVVSFDCLVDKVYLSRAIDRCRWKDQDCVFKRVEFDCDIETLDREIKSRERLLNVIAPHGEDNEDANETMEKRFNVIPILAGVVVQEGEEDHVIGILMPFGGPSLESLAESEPSSTTPASNARDLGISRRELRDLARGVSELAQAGVVHGDINDRNILRKACEVSTADGKRGQSCLVLVDLGDVAPEYKNDAFALGEIFIWCKEHSSWGASDQREVEDAAKVLKEHGDFDQALKILDDEGDR